MKHLLTIVMLPLTASPSVADPAASMRPTQLLPGHREFVFSMYGCPHDIEEVKDLVAVMKHHGLGNGFDPGPAARAASRPLFEYLGSIGWPVVCYPGWSDMQVKNGRARLGDDDETAMHVLDQAGVFSAIQLGEWGYFFHNLSPRNPGPRGDSWWRDVYGDQFDQYKHLMKPVGLKGYDTQPASRRQCYEVVRDYFLTRDMAMRGRTISVTGHSHYEAYAGEWGARAIGLEVGENIAFTQSKIAFARGAARQWNRPWTLQVSPWFAGSCTTSGPLRREGNYARGLDAGHSLSLYQRLWLHGWFAGAAMVTPENSIAIFFEQQQSPWKLTSHGQKAAKVFALMRSHDRGIPFTPVAIVLDHLAGYNAYQGRPWGILDKTAGDQEVYDLFQQQLFPGSDHIHVRPDPGNPEASYLRPTPYGEVFDVLLSSASAETLRCYPVILLVGDIQFSQELLNRLTDAAASGSQLLIHQRHAESLGERLERLRQAGTVEVLARWTNPATGRSAAISHERLEELTSTLLPVTISGNPIQYQINRNRNGWVVELIHNGGVVKQPAQPATVNHQAAARVDLRPRVAVERVREWHSGETFASDRPVTVDVPAGQTRFVEFQIASPKFDSIPRQVRAETRKSSAAAARRLAQIQ